MASGREKYRCDYNHLALAELKQQQMQQDKRKKELRSEKKIEVDLM